MKTLISILLAILMVLSLAACHPGGAGNTASSSTEGSTAASTEATVLTTQATEPLIMGDVYVLIRDMDDPTSIISRKIVLFEDGTYYSNTSPLSSAGPAEGEWEIKDGYLYLYWSGLVQQQPTERMSKFKFEDGVLTFVKKGDDDVIRDIRSMSDIPDGTNYIFAGTGHKNPSN